MYEFQYMLFYLCFLHKTLAISSSYYELKKQIQHMQNK